MAGNATQKSRVNIKKRMLPCISSQKGHAKHEEMHVAQSGWIVISHPIAL